MNKLNEENQEKNLKNELFENSPISIEQKHQETKSTFSGSIKPLKKLNYLIKGIQDFSKRYNSDSMNALTDKKFLLSFNQIISLINEVIDYQNKIIELESSEKEKMQNISQDFINKLSYTIFSYEKVEILNNEKNKYKSNKKIRNQILYNKKISKPQPRFNFSNSNIISNNNIEEDVKKNNNTMSKYFSSNYIAETNNIQIKTKKKDEIKEKNKLHKVIKCYNSNIRSYINDKKIINNDKTVRSFFNKKKNKKLKIQTEGNKNFKKEEKIKINKNKNLKIISTTFYTTNIKENYNNPKTTRNSEKKQLNTFNSHLDYSLKNNSVILRSSSLKNKSYKENETNIMAYNFYNTFNDFEQKLLDSQPVKEGYIIKGKINIFSKVPKPSILANKLLECSKKYINDYNGVNEEERKKNRFHTHSHSFKNKYKNKK